MHRHIGLPAAVLAMLCACDALFDDNAERIRLGTISYYSEPVVIELPDTVTSGQPFAVLVRTYGGGCVGGGRTDVVVRGLQATITPYDKHPRNPDVNCPDILRMIDHETTVTLEQVGTALLRFRGRREPEDTVMTEVRTVRVR